MDGTNGSLSLASRESVMQSWVYIKEGNASVVIGHKTEHIIYQMHKCAAQAPGTENSREAVCQAKIDYIERVLKPLCGRFANVPQCVPVTPEFVMSVSEAFSTQRPAKRRHKVIDPSQRFILSQPNFCFLERQNVGRKHSTLTFELKPKLGFIPFSHVASQNNDCKKAVCNFCMQQHLKYKEGDWAYMSQYCPVSLFSGNHKNMRHALEGLFSTPQNNLCVFKDGELIYPGGGTSLPSEEERENLVGVIRTWLGTSGQGMTALDDASPDAFTKSSSIQELISLLIQALCKPDDNSRQMKIEKEMLPWKPCLAHHCDGQDESMHCELPEGCILYHILSAQRLDSHGIQFIYPVYQRYMDYMAQHPDDSKRFSIDDPCIPNYLTYDPSTVPYCTSDEIPRLPMGVCTSLLRRYMVTRTARDCSVMVTLQPVHEEDIDSTEDTIISAGNRRFKFACNLIDLDSKSPSKIPYYHRLEQLINDTYLDR